MLMMMSLQKAEGVDWFKSGAKIDFFPIAIGTFEMTRIQ